MWGIPFASFVAEGHADQLDPLQVHNLARGLADSPHFEPLLVVRGPEWLEIFPLFSDSRALYSLLRLRGIFIDPLSYVLVLLFR